MINKRIILNLGIFAAIGVTLGLWAIGDVLQIDLGNPPYEITADFEDSPGLQPGYDVGYLGTPIGRIKGVDLDEGHVLVTMSIESGREIPAGSTLAVRRKSAVGEPYVDITPPDDVGEDGPLMEDGAHVPIERTATPLSYSELFNSLDDLISTVPEDDLATLFHEFAIAVDGRSGSLRNMITGSADALDTFAENADLLESSTASLSRLTRVFAEHRTAFSEGLSNTTEVTGTLAAARADLERLLADGDGLATRSADLISEAGPDLACTLGGLSEMASGLDRTEVLAALESLLASAPDAAFVFRDVIAWEADGPYIRAVPPLNVGGTEPVPVYESPRSLPGVNEVAGCDALTPAEAPGGAGTTGPGGRGGVDGGPSPASEPGGDTGVGGEQASSDQAVDESSWNPLMILLVLLAIALVAALRPWRVFDRR
jgi:phospholipid/cholesterol/gamma-HCH transport system substrate-binding protein